LIKNYLKTREVKSTNRTSTTLRQAASLFSNTLELKAIKYTLKFSFGGFIEIRYVMFIIQIFTNIQNAIILEDTMKRMNKLNPFSAQTQQNSPFCAGLMNMLKSHIFALSSTYKLSL